MATKTAVDEVLEKFDFARVHKAMEALNWTYFDSHGVPSVERLKELARQHLESLLEDVDCSMSGSGGFEAYRYTDEFTDDGIGLRFVLTDAESE